MFGLAGVLETRVRCSQDSRDGVGTGRLPLKVVAVNSIVPQSHDVRINCGRNKFGFSVKLQNTDLRDTTET